MPCSASQIVRALTIAVLPLAVLVGLPQSANAAQSITLRIADTTLIPGEVASASGRASTPIRRKVRLQLRVGGAWATVASGRTSKSGAYTLEDPKSRVGRYRVVAPRKQARNRSYKRLISPVRTVVIADALQPGETLTNGGFIQSADGVSKLVMQTDGNLVVYRNGVAVWSTSTSGAERVLRMQTDGNLVIYSGATAIWSSNTSGYAGAFVRIQDDGNLVVYRGTEALWSRSDGVLYNQLRAAKTLQNGAFIQSANRTYKAVMQADGNFVVYRNGTTALWSASSNGANRVLKMQTDGNLVIYSGATAIWSSNTSGYAGSRLVMQDDGNLVIYSGSRALWSLGTVLYNQLHPGQSLTGGASIQSANRTYRLVMQADGNLVLYQNGTTPLWSSDTSGSGNRVVMQADGNLVLYRSDNTPLWDSGTGVPGGRLVVQDDGNLVIYSGNTAVWSRHSTSSIEGPYLLPFRAGAPGIRINCTWSNGCSDSYHGWFAIDFNAGYGTPIYAAGDGQLTGHGGCAPNVGGRAQTGAAWNSPAPCAGLAGRVKGISNPTLVLAWSIQASGT